MNLLNSYNLSRALCLPILALAVSSFCGAQEPQSVTQPAENRGKTELKLRSRFENVTDDGVGEKEASATTIRTTLAHRTGKWRGVSVFAEVENVTAGDNDTFNNKGAGNLDNGVIDRPVVADPELTEFNQAYVSFEKGATRLRVGRQEIVLGDSRFVGNVGWRQNHQSFDGVSLSTGALGRTTLEYAYIGAVNRIFGDQKRMNSHILRAAVRLTDSATLTAYGHLLDYERPVDASLSTSTYGIELRAAHAVGANGKLQYELEYANQTDFADNPESVDAAYHTASLGGVIRGFSVTLRSEVLEGSPENGKFTTPLATLHKFNGWADKFLATPTNGLEDLSIDFGSKIGPFRWAATYHDFRANTGGASYGTEIDVLAVLETRWNQTFGMKVAAYNAATHAFDTEKLMIWTAYSF